MKNTSSEQILSELTIACCRNWMEDIQDILNSHLTIDITYDDGCLFGLAIVVKTDSPAMLELLIGYYKKTRMQGDPRSEEYIAAKERLLEILEKEGNWPNVAPEIQKVLDRYLKDDDTDMEFDPADFGAPDLPTDDEIITGSAHDSDSCLPLTEENLGILKRMSSISVDDESSYNKIPTPTESSKIGQSILAPQHADFPSDTDNSSLLPIGEVTKPTLEENN